MYIGLIAIDFPFSILGKVVTPKIFAILLYWPTEIIFTGFSSAFTSLPDSIFELEDSPLLLITDIVV